MTYATQIVEKINHYKRKSCTDNLVLIPILDANQNTIGFLHPITADFQATIKDCVELLCRWRAENASLSPTQFQVTYAGTKRWIENLIVQNDQRILFMVQAISGTYIGHMGLANFCHETQTAEIDLVVRGEKSIAHGLMGYAMAALIRWGQQELNLKHIELDVLWDNEHAISFYERCGFHRGELIPLKRKETECEVRWVPHKGAQLKAEKYYLHMTLY